MTVAPNITTPMEGEEFNITEGSNGSITCTATGYPVPTVVWQNSDGSSLSNDRLVSGSSVISSTGVGNASSVSVHLMMIGAMRVDSECIDVQLIIVSVMLLGISLSLYSVSVSVCACICVCMCTYARICLCMYV